MNEEKKLLKIAIIGFGSRGQMFGALAASDPRVKIAAIADPEAACREKAKSYVGEDGIFRTADEFFAKGKICDAALICSQDADHREMALKAMTIGYDLLLEKPAACTEEDCIAIRDEAKRLGCKVMLTHVLRYAPAFGYVKKLIKEGVLGKIVNIEQTENVAYWHFALSYVRGPWRNVERSSPTIIAKCCHDLDLIRWFMDKKCVSVSSYGGLYYFNAKNAPDGSAPYCADCDENTRKDCLYNSYAIYPERIKHAVVGGTARLVDKDINKVIDEKSDPIAKCVFHSGNDAVDNQVVNMLFEDGATANLTMIAYSKDCYRYLHVHGTKGDVSVLGDDMKVHVNIYDRPSFIADPATDETINPLKIGTGGGHGGGDTYLFDDFVDYVTKNSPSITRTTIEDSIESHLMGFCAEKSRKLGGEPVKL